MIKQISFLPMAIASLLLIISCNLTRKNVIGKWKGQFDDTLIINQDNSFLLIKDKFSKTNLTDSSQKYLTGKWTLKKKSIYFKFADSTKSFGGGCRSYHYWWTRGSKKKLVRPMTCKIPTHHFEVINKIE